MRRSHLRRLIAVVVIVVLAATGCASAPVSTATHSPLDVGQLTRTYGRLSAAGDADSLAAAALIDRVILWQEGNSDGARTSAVVQTLLARATAAAPDRPDLLFLQLRLCVQQSSFNTRFVESTACDWRAIEARLRVVAPGNGTAWLYSLDHATASHDVPAARAALPIPDLRTVLRACAADQLAPPDILEDCRNTARAFQAGDWELAQSIGLRLAIGLRPADSPQNRDALAAQRTLEYRLDLIGQSDALSEDLQARPKAALALYSTYRTDQDLWRAVLIRVGLNPDPPSDWIHRAGVVCSKDCATACAALNAPL